MKARGPDQFSLYEYARLVDTLLSAGYSCVGIESIRANEPVVFIRHDVDFCPRRALSMAKAENAIGAFSTYYFLVSTNFYNVADARTRDMIQEIATLGYRIGLHFDATRYGEERAALENGASREIGILEACGGCVVASVSFHRPATELRGLKGRFAGRRHAYEPEFFSEIGYVSDSNGAVHYGHPLDLPAFKNRTAVHFLTHPIWWVAEPSEDHIAKLERFRFERETEFIDDIAGTVKVYNDWLRSRLAVSG